MFVKPISSFFKASWNRKNMQQYFKGKFIDCHLTKLRYYRLFFVIAWKKQYYLLFWGTGLLTLQQDYAAFFFYLVIEIKNVIPSTCKKIDLNHMWLLNDIVLQSFALALYYHFTTTPIAIEFLVLGFQFKE